MIHKMKNNIKKPVLLKGRACLEPVVPPQLSCALQHNSSLRGRSSFNRPSLLTVRFRPAFSLALSGGFDVRCIYRLPLSRLAARLRLRLLILIGAFSVFNWLCLEYIMSGSMSSEIGLKNSSGHIYSCEKNTLFTSVNSCTACIPISRPIPLFL
jgi:hypothetical protein